jgi:DNA (cytosine-5)-methyltransferase 1
MNLNDKKPTFLSLFSGCGGFDQGFEDNGYESLGAFDNDPAVLDVYKNNLKGPTYLHDLSNHTLPVDYTSKSIDVLVSGSPCQGFSTAGLRDLNDPRNKLLLVGGSIAKTLSPKVIVCENVMGSLSGAHKIYWEQLVQDLTKLGYNMDFIECCASDFGIAQLRKRVFLIAWKGNKKAIPKLGNSPKKNLKDVLENVEEVANHNHFIPIKNKDIYKLVKRIKSGQKLCNVRGGENAIHTWDIPEVFGDVTNNEKEVLNLIKTLRRQIRIRDFGDADPVSYDDIQARCGFPVKKVLDSLLAKDFLRFVNGKYDIKHAYNGLYKRLEWDKCSMTVDTRFGNPRYFLHPEEHRGFTVREAARIQGFKDSFIFKGSVTKQFKMIGNAVPPPIADKIAKFIKENLL